MTMSVTNGESKSYLELESIDRNNIIEGEFSHEELPDDVRFYSDSRCRTIKRLSVSQVVMGALGILFNIPLFVINTVSYNSINGFLASGVWGGLFILLTGIVGLRATRLQSLGKVAACLVLNILCTLSSIAMLGISAAGLSMSAGSFYKDCQSVPANCGNAVEQELVNGTRGVSSMNGTIVQKDYESCDCSKQGGVNPRLLEAVLTVAAETVLMTLSLSQFCITIAISVLSCKTISRHSPPLRMKRADTGQGQANDRATSSKHTPSPKSISTIPAATKAKLSEDTIAKVKLCEIDGQLLDIGSVIGNGYFGSVHRGTYTADGRVQTVAVKTLKGESLDISQIEQFLVEGTLMMHLKHANILSLVGVVYEVGSFPMVVLPFMCNGDLKSLIQRDNIVVVLGDLLHFGLQISHGMAYLSRERFVHRDLAARNCMVDSSLIIKIGDFGMSRDVYTKDYYVMDDKDKPLPLKWMAPESMTEGRFTSSTDMWSFGVLLWELLTLGCTPYPTVRNREMKDYILSNKRLDRPQCCPPIIFDMMLLCWSIEPEERPSFTQWSEFLDNLLTDNQPESKPEDIYSYARVATKKINHNYQAEYF